MIKLKKTIIISCLLCLSLNLHAESLEDYLSTISNLCPVSNKLIIKKSLIELTSAQNCTTLFTSLLLKDCPQLNCNSLVDHWVAFNSKNSGAVIGK